MALIPTIPIALQWDAAYEIESQIITHQYQEGVRQARRRNRINHTLAKVQCRVYADSFTAAALLETFLITPPGKLFKLEEGSSYIWRCMTYEKSLTGSKGQTFFTLQLQQVRKP